MHNCSFLILCILSTFLIMQFSYQISGKRKIVSEKYTWLLWGLMPTLEKVWDDSRTISMTYLWSLMCYCYLKKHTEGTWYLWHKWMGILDYLWAFFRYWVSLNNFSYVYWLIFFFVSLLFISFIISWLMFLLLTCKMFYICKIVQLCYKFCKYFL